MTNKRGKTWHLRFYPYPGVLAQVSTPAETEKEAERIERAIKVACENQDFRILDPVSREVCVRIFRNKKWEVPNDLSGTPERRPTDQLTLMNAAKLFMKDKTVKDKKTTWRYEYCILHLLEKLGKDRPIKSLWVTDLEQYQEERTRDGAAAATINWELATLSKMFWILIKNRLVQENPVSFTESLPTTSGERHVYLAIKDVKRIADRSPAWSRPIIWTAYYSGMRRGEILGLTRKQINLSSRIITLYPDSEMDGGRTKEGH